MNQSPKTAVSLFLLALIPVLASIVYVPIPLFRDHIAIAEPILFLSIAVILCIQFTISKPSISISWFELFLVGCGIYTLANSFFQHGLTIPTAISLLCPPLLYSATRAISRHSVQALCIALAIGMSILLILYFVTMLYGSTGMQSSLRYFYIPNISVFSILLSSQALFLLGVYIELRTQDGISNVRTTGLLVLLILAGIFLVVCNGRAAWVGCALALLFYWYVYKKPRKPLILVAGVFLCIFVVGSLWYKVDSSSGRMLIYKVSLSIAKDNVLCGIGSGKFKVKYNDYQSQYFAAHSIDSKEALLADTSFYAFNDILQFFVENGSVGIIILVLASIVFIRTSWNTMRRGQFRGSSISITASLISLVPALIVFYPLHVVPISVHGAIFAALFICIFDTSKQIALSPLGSKSIKGMFIVLSLIVCLLSAMLLSHNTTSTHAAELSRNGFKREALATYATLDERYIQDGKTVFLYARALYYADDLSTARRMITLTKQYYCSQEVYALSGAIEEELHSYPAAERDYKTAVYMVPNRMQSRYDLFQYYLRRKDTINCRFWGNSIMGMPIKVPSKTTAYLLSATTEILKTLN